MAAEDLQGYGPPGSVASQIDFAHAADADERFDFVIGHALTGREAAGLAIQQIGGDVGGGGEQSVAGIGFEQGFDFLAQFGGRAGEQGFAVAHGAGPGLVVEALDVFPGRRIHDGSRFISRISQLRASRQSRLTVPTETPMASAVSSMLRPPK